MLGRSLNGHPRAGRARAEAVLNCHAARTGAVGVQAADSRARIPGTARGGGGSRRLDEHDIVMGVRRCVIQCHVGNYARPRAADGGDRYAEPRRRHRRISAEVAAPQDLAKGYSGSTGRVGCSHYGHRDRREADRSGGGHRQGRLDHECHLSPTSYSANPNSNHRFRITELGYEQQASRESMAESGTSSAGDRQGQECGRFTEVRR